MKTNLEENETSIVPKYITHSVYLSTTKLTQVSRVYFDFNTF